MVILGEASFFRYYSKPYLVFSCHKTRKPVSVLPKPSIVYCYVKWSLFGCTGPTQRGKSPSSNQSQLGIADCRLSWRSCWFLDTTHVLMRARIQQRACQRSIRFLYRTLFYQGCVFCKKLLQTSSMQSSHPSDEWVWLPINCMDRSCCIFCRWKRSLP